MLAEKGAELGGPWSDHLEGAVWELRIRLRDVAAGSVRVYSYGDARADLVVKQGCPEPGEGCHIPARFNVQVTAADGTTGGTYAPTGG